MRFVLACVLLGCWAPFLRADTTKLSVRLTAADGVHLAGDYFKPGQRGPGVLLFHQCSRDRSVWDGLARALANGGSHVLVVNPRGIGDSEGEQWDYDENLQHALDYWRKNWSRDAETAYQWLISQPDVKADSVVAIGGGCGAFLALVTAQNHYPKVHSAVLFSDFDDDSIRGFLRAKPELAILSAVSERDAMSFEAAKDIHSLSHHPASRLLTYAEQGHGFGLIEKHPELQQTAVVWVETRLRAAESSDVAEILAIHERDRDDHMRGDFADLASRHAVEFVSVADGKVARSTREEALRDMRGYFGSRKHRAWEDLEPPVVHVSPRGDMAWAVYRVRSRYTETKPDGTGQDGEFVCAWTSTYEKRDGRWLMTSVTSTFEARDSAN